MTIYKRVEIVDGETKEPVQFVALHPFAWPEDYTPTAAFVEDEDATARLTAADALAADAKTTILVMYTAQTCIWELHGTDNSITRNLQTAIDELEDVLRQYEATK